MFRGQGICCWSGTRSNSRQTCCEDYEWSVRGLSGPIVSKSVDCRARAANLFDGKLVVSKKRWVVEIQDILTWTEAFTIFQMVMCAIHPHCWPDLTKYKLLIIQMARQSPSRAWLEYDLAFRKDAAATGASDWSKMNLDLYNFHLRSPAPLAKPQSSTSPPVTLSASRGYISQPPYCISWNNGQCRWPFGECRYCHVCSSCNSDHPRVSCPFHPPRGRSLTFPFPCQRGAVLRGLPVLLLLVYIV